MYSKRNVNYIQLLLNQDKRIFRVSELALVWGITKKNSLNTMCKRYQQVGKLHRLARGIYSVVPIRKLDPLEIGVAVAGCLSYISTESVLVEKGLMMQAVRKITIVGKKSKEFKVGEYEYICRYMSMKRLVMREGIEIASGYEIANKERALADMKIINPKYYLDMRNI